MWQLAIEPKNDMGAFGSAMAKDKSADEFREYNTIFGIIFSVWVDAIF